MGDHTIDSAGVGTVEADEPPPIATNQRAVKTSQEIKVMDSTQSHAWRSKTIRADTSNYVRANHKMTPASVSIYNTTNPRKRE